MRRYLSPFILYINVKVGKNRYEMLDKYGGKIAVHLAVAGDVFDGVFVYCPFSDEMSWMRSVT